MKFRAEPKDIVIFVLFCILLLYMVAIGVLNFSYLAQYNKFAGLNPLPAFTAEYFAPTMVFYIIALIAIIMSTGSKFFSRESGFGIVTEKKSDGTSRWAKAKEMKKNLVKEMAFNKEFKAGGMPIITDGNELWIDDGEAHNLIIGTTGSGKSRRFAHPLINVLGKKGESMILTDPKGELYEENAEFLKERGYNIVVVNLRNPHLGQAWNPLSLPYRLYKEGNNDKAIELLDDLAINILYDESNKNGDPFWEKTSADYFTGLSLGLFEDATEEQINLNSINLMTTIGEEKFAGSTYIKEYFNMKDPSKPAYVNASSTILAPSETKGSILSVFKQKIKLFSSKENLSEMLSYSDFDMKDIGRNKTAVFIIIQDEKKTYHPLATIFLKQCYETLIDVAQENGGTLPYRTNFILDEFANMPPLKDVTTMITAARSRKIRFYLIIQNFAQLNEVYGKENAETIKGNCNKIYLLSSELQSLEEISKLCGDEKVKGKDGKPDDKKPLVTISDLQQMKMGEAIIMKLRSYPFKTKFPDISQYNFGNKKYDKASLAERERKPIQTFNVRDFVKEKKQAGLFSMFDQGNNNPFGGPPMPPMFPGFDNKPDMNSNNPTPPGGIDVDALVKRIDEKIAQLEEEERLEKEKQDKEKNGESAINDTSPSSIDKTDDKTEEITDDEFFDDFFLDD